MRWSEIVLQVRDRLQEESESFFSDERLMDIARRVQAEVAVVTECVEATDTIEVSAGAVEVALPEDCTGILCASCDDYPLTRVDFRRARQKVYPHGRPCCFYVFGENAGLYPAPSSAVVLKLWYSQRPPLGAMTLKHSGAGGASDATFEVRDGVLTLVVTGGSNAGTYPFTLSSAGFDTVGEVVDGINALNKGWTAARVRGCRANERSANLEADGSFSAFQKTAVVDLAVKLPGQFQQLIELGTIYRALWKDTEYEAGEVYKKEYLERLDAMRRVYARRVSRVGAGSVRDAYRGQGCGGGAGIKVFVP